jgi:hypothetical protein
LLKTAFCADECLVLQIKSAVGSFDQLEPQFTARICRTATMAAVESWRDGGLLTPFFQCRVFSMTPWLNRAARPAAASSSSSFAPNARAPSFAPNRIPAKKESAKKKQNTSRCPKA